MPETKHKTSKTAKTANTDNVLAPPPVELRSKVTSMTTMARVKLGLWCQSVRAAASLSRGALGRHSPSWRTAGAVLAQSRRHVSLHEHHSMDLMSSFGISVPYGEVASTAEQAQDITERLGGVSVLKAQVLAGGRGLGRFDSGLEGGVKIVNSPEEARDIASQMIGHQLHTKQTGAVGRPCRKVLVSEKLELVNEYYFAVVMERSFMGPAMIASPHGGVNIEEIARTNPSAILKEPVDIFEGIQREQAEKMVQFLGIPPEITDSAVDQIMRLYQMFIERDCTTLEINPLATDSQNRLLCMDAKINFDDNSEYRQKKVFSLRDWSQEDPRDVEAAKSGITYIGLDGSIGCLVNGAGLAMATMDIIKLYGGEPANFLDIGGGASAKEVMDGFEIFHNDHNVNAVFVNIFGGIVRCDEIARGIIAAAQEINITVPIVVRLQGNRQKKAKAMIEASGLKMIAVEDFDLAARTVVNVSKICELAKSVDITIDFSSH